MNILILEDEENDKILLVEYLKSTPLDFEYSHAHDKNSYLQLIRSQSFDCVLSDFNIPGYDVEEAFQEARKENDYMPFIIVSGVIEHEYAVRLVTELGISDFILKDNLNRLYDSITREIKSSETKRELDKAQKELTDQNRRLIRAQEVAKLGDWSYDLEKQSITWGAETFHLFDRDLSQGSPSFDELLDYYPGESKTRLQNAVEKAAADGSPYEMVLLVDTGVSKKYINHVGTVTKNQTGDITTLHGIVQDVTPRKEMEDQLEKQNIRLKRAQKVAKLGDWTFDLHSGAITWSNELFEIYERDISEGPPSYEEMFEKYYLGEEGEKLQQVVKEAIENAVPYELDLYVQTQSGVKCIHHIGTPETDDQGKVTGLHGIIQDVTSSKEMEDALYNKEHSISVIADNINGVLLRYVLYPDGSDGLLTVSDGVERVFGISTEEALKDVNLMWSRILEEDLEDMKYSILESAKKDADWDHTWRIRNAEGDIRYIHGMGRPIIKENGEVIWDSLLLDVTDVRDLQKNIIESERRLDAAIAGANLGVWDLNVKTGKNYTNERWWTMLGYTENEMEFTYEFFHELLHPDDKDKPAREIQRIENGGDNNIDIVIRMRHKDGSYRTLLDRGRVVSMDEDGKIERMIGTNLDITEKIELENELRESNYRLETAVEGADLGVWDSNLAKETTIANERWHEMLGYDPEEIQDAHTLYNLFFDNLHPDDKPKIIQELSRIKEGVKESFHLTLRVKNKKGDYFTILDKGRALEFDENGKAKRMIGTVLDITKEVELETKLKESKFRLQTAAEGAKLGIWDSNIRDGTNIANDRWFEMLGYTRDEVKGDSFPFFFSRIHPEDVEKIMDAINTIEKGSKESFEEIIRVKHKSGEYLTILDKGTALEYDSNGKVTRMIGTHLDITELVSTQKRLQKSLNEKDLLIKEVHHRVKNNLAILAGLLELDIFAKGENSVLSDAISRIRSIAFVHELLYQTESMVEIDFRQYLDSYTNHIKKTYSIDDQKIVIDTRVLSSTINVNEAVPLGLVINELVTNSLKYGIPEGGRITIKLTSDQEHENKHRFYYADSGPGYDAKAVQNGNIGLELISTLLANLHAEYELKTDGQFELDAYFIPKKRGAYGNPLKQKEQD